MSQQADTLAMHRMAPPSTLVLPGSASVLAALADAVSILAAGALTEITYWVLTDVPLGLDVVLDVSALLSVLFVILMQSWGLYDTRNLLAVDRQAKWAVAAWFAALGLVLGVAFLLKTSAELSRGALVLCAGIGLAFLVGLRLTWRFAFASALHSGLLRRRNAFVLSPSPLSPAGPELRILRRAEIAVLQHYVVPSAPEARRRTIAAILSASREQIPDEIVVLASEGELPQVDAILAELRSLPVPVRLMPDLALSRLALQPSCRIGAQALIEIRRAPLSPREQAGKRALDLAVATIGLLVAAPLLLAAMAAIRLETPGPVLFRQSRRGFNGRTFRILKLRTMTVLEDGASLAQATRFDPRITRVGAWLRRTSIDELPQLWNVLRGEMSVVGPRPHAVAHDDHYHALIQNYAFRHHVKPGITGWAQVNGYRGETPAVSMMAARVEHDIWYVSNWSLRTDLRILFLTVTHLLSPNAY
ncbi:MAG: putative glycosyl transferase [Enterovirga sp.]|jgi:putative colanic acid biosynthesis UDP-glucose lipid carrier transferase|nr:putative glycosyl transferase [Enterovirga sp.]